MFSFVNLQSPDLSEEIIFEHSSAAVAVEPAAQLYTEPPGSVGPGI